MQKGKGIIIMQTEIMKGNDKILFCPDGLTHASIPYILGHLNCEYTTSFKKLLQSKHKTILFSWSFLWQDVSWVEKLKKSHIIIGGSAVKYLSSKDELPIYDNVDYITHDIDYPLPETRVIPNYRYTIESSPFDSDLKVYSGYGCNWGHCTFCTWTGGKHTQFDPKYVASIILHANRYGKLAGLSAPTHTVEWLEEVERYLPGNHRRYWCYVNAHDNEWKRIKKAKEIFIGSEYLSNSVLNRIKKGVSAEKIMSSIKEILSAGINVYSTIIEDLYENEDELHEHIENKIDLLSVTAPPRLGYGKLWLASCRLINKDHYDTEGYIV